MIRVFIVLLALWSNPIFSQQMYKCLQDNGSTSFQALPCSKTDHGEKIRVDVQKPADGPVVNYYPMEVNKQESIKTATDKAIKQYNRNNKKLWDQYYQKKCARYTQYYDEAKEDWEYQMHAGYSEAQKHRMLIAIKSAKRDMERECSEKY
jgi:hypothetical protein